jgi:hypothetical protein
MHRAIDTEELLGCLTHNLWKPSFGSGAYYHIVWSERVQRNIRPERA